MQQPGQINRSSTAYLAPPRYCRITTAIAITLTTMLAALFAYFALNGRNLLFHAGIDDQLKISLELAFMVLCTAAVWKHARRA